MCKEKYIYVIKDNLYRIKIVKKNPNIHYDKYFNCNLEDAIKIRNEILKKINKNKNILIEK